MEGQKGIAILPYLPISLSPLPLRASVPPWLFSFMQEADSTLFHLMLAIIPQERNMT